MAIKTSILTDAASTQEARLADILGQLLIIEFSGVDADNNKLVFIFCLQRFEVRDYVHAVDAAIDPEIEENDFAFEALNCPGRRIQPGQVPGEFGGFDAIISPGERHGKTAEG